MEHTPIGRHGGASRLRKAYRLLQRTAGMRRFGRGQRLRSGARPRLQRPRDRRPALGVPEANMHDYEYAVTQHRIGCRLASG